MSKKIELTGTEWAVLNATFEGWIRMRVEEIGLEKIRDLETDFMVAKDYPGYVGALLNALGVKP